MLGVTTKATSQIDIGNVLTDYVKQNYSPEDAKSIQSGCSALNSQRAALLSALDSNASLADYKAAFNAYIGSFHLATRRFPFGDDARTGFLGHRLGKPRAVHIHFTYVDALCPANQAASTDPRYELCAQVFNYAARLSREALAAKARPEGGLNDACKLFREAAGAFDFLAHPKLVMPLPVSMDITPPVAAFFAQLMLAQAQVCVFEKATQNAFSPDLIAKIAADAHAKFAVLLQRLANDSLAVSATGGMSVGKYFAGCTFKWASNAQLQAGLYAAQASYWMARSRFEARKWGDEIGYLRVALSQVEATRACDGAVRLGNPVAVSQRDALATSIRARLTQAEQTNSTAYFDGIPDSMPSVPAQSMATMVSFDEAWAAATGSATDEFRTLVSPEERAAAAAVAADLGKAASAAAAAAAAKTAATRERLSALSLPTALDLYERAAAAPAAAASAAAKPEGAEVPDELWARVCEFKTQGGLAQLRRSAKELEAASSDAAARVASAKQALANEAAGDAAMRAQFQSRWQRSASAPLSSSLTDMLAGVEGLLADAAGVSRAVIADLAAAEPALQALDADRITIARALPRPAPVAAGGAAAGKPGAAAATAAAAALRKALDALTALLAEREALARTALAAAGVEGDAHADAHGVAAKAGTPTAAAGASAAGAKLDVLGRIHAGAEAGKGRETVAADLAAELAAHTDKLAAVEPREAALLQEVESANASFVAATTAFSASGGGGGGAGGDPALSAALGALYGACDTAAKLRASLDEGRRFCADLQRDTLEPLQQRVGDFVMARDIEKRVHIEDLTAALGAMAVTTTPSGGAPGSSSLAGSAGSAGFASHGSSGSTSGAGMNNSYSGGSYGGGNSGMSNNNSGGYYGQQQQYGNSGSYNNQQQQPPQQYYGGYPPQPQQQQHQQPWGGYNNNNNNNNGGNQQGW